MVGTTIEMDRCSLCPAIHKCIPPDIGTGGDDIIFIGEAPGYNEQREGRVFVGKTGREVNEHYLPLAGLRRQNVTFTNAIKCLPPGPQGKINLNRTKDVEMLMSCAVQHLFPEINAAKLLVPMGAFACYALDPEINLDLQHGIPLETSWGTVFPMYHPAMGIHEPKKMLLIRNDWIRLGKYLKGKLKPRVDPCTQTDYRHIGSDELLSDYLECNDYTLPMACDTEITRFHKPFCLTFSKCPGTGYLIKADDKDSLDIFQAIIDRQTGPILFHNYLFDQRVIEDMGLRIPWSKVTDTMVRAYHLGNVPQGLKALAYRELGIRMVDFEDTVVPHSTPIALKYMRDAYDLEWPRPDAELVRDDKGQWRVYQAQSLNTKLKRFLTDYAKKPKDVFEAWANWPESHKTVEGILGPWPGKCITHVPFEQVIEYAARDADATLRLWHKLQSMTRKVRRGPQEAWGDA